MEMSGSGTVFYDGDRSPHVELTELEKKASMDKWDAENKAEQVKFFGRDHRSIDRHRRGSAFAKPTLKHMKHMASNETTSTATSSPSPKSLQCSSSGRSTSKSQKNRHRRRRSSVKEIGGAIAQRFSVRHNARLANNKRKRKRKVCCLLRSSAFLAFLLKIFGERFDVRQLDMPLLASRLNGRQQCLTFLYTLLLFFVVPWSFCGALWSLPLEPLPRTEFNVTTRVGGVLIGGPMTYTQQPVYFWCTLPLVLSTLAAVPALWYHSTTGLPLVNSLVISLLTSVPSGLFAANLLCHLTGKKDWNALVAMAVVFVVSLFSLTIASIRHGLLLHAKGGFRTFRAATLIQRAWVSYKGGMGAGLMKVNPWMKDSGIDEHSVVMDEVTLFRGVHKDVKSRLMMVMQPKEFVQGDYICTEGEPGQHFYIIVKGTVSVRCKAKSRGKSNFDDDVDVDVDVEENEDENEDEKEEERKEDGKESDYQYNLQRKKKKKEKKDKEVEICRMHGGDYFGEVALLQRQGGGNSIRSASVVVVSPKAEMLAISSHNFLKRVLPFLSADASGRLKRACQRRLAHTSEFRLEQQPVARFIRRSLHYLSRNGPADDNAFNGRGGPELSSSEEDDSGSDSAEETEINIEFGERRATTSTTGAVNGVRITRFNSTHSVNSVSSAPSRLKNGTSIPELKKRHTSALSMYKSANLNRRKSAAATLIARRKSQKVDQRKLRQQQQQQTSISQAQRLSALVEQKEEKEKEEEEEEDKKEKKEKKEEKKEEKEKKKEKEETFGRKSSIHRAVSNDFLNVKIDDNGNEVIALATNFMSTTATEPTDMVQTLPEELSIIARHPESISSSNPSSSNPLRRARGSSFRLHSVSKSGRRRTHSNADTNLPKNDSLFFVLHNEYEALHSGIRRKACKTAFALFSSFLLYPCFLAYLWGFTRITNSTNPRVKGWAPFYALLVGPLRLLSQSIGEATIAKADRFTARAAGAWTLALGVSLFLSFLCLI